MEKAAYILALLTVVSFPPAILFWFLIHPFARSWRKLGAVWTYSIVLPVLVLIGSGIYRLREALLSVRFEGSVLLLLAGLFLFLLSIGIGFFRAKALKVSVLVGVPELSKGKGPGRLYTSGIYGRLRNPRYVEGGLALAAIALVTGYLAVYLLFVLYLPLIFLVVLLEERELAERFGEEYERYLREVPRFLPRLRKGGGGGRFSASRSVAVRTAGGA